MTSRRVFLCRATQSAVLAAFSFSGTTAQASDYPNKAIRLVVPFPPGSTTDSAARFFSERISKTLKQPVVVENKAGAQGALGARDFLKYPPDGYALFLASNSTHAANVHLFKDPGYDPVKDFAPVLQVSVNPLVLVVNPALPVHNLDEFLKYAKQRAGAMNYGVGNSSGLAAVHLLKQATGIAAQDINYPGTPPAVNDLIAGRLDFIITDISVTRSFIEAGRLRAIGVATAERLKTLPNVPTIAEGGVPGFEFSAWNGLFVPAKTPPDIIAKLQATFAAAMREPGAAEFFDRLGVVPVGGSTADFKKYVDDQIKLWGKIVNDAGIPKI